MFSEDLQKLIEASLVDGVITDQERAVIRKRALLEGVDPDEVDLMLDAEVQKIINEAHEEAKNIILKYKDDVELIAKTLLEYEQITAEEIDYLLEHRHLKKAEKEKVDEQPVQVEPEPVEGENKGE